ncbi:MAG: tRNA pseudouridine(65) synthase TruC [Bdellovibrionales bacterium]|nr:tRNA pseudouridine(65) synthase TruC [Bdellovibrionales bacterium]
MPRLAYGKPAVLEQPSLYLRILFENPDYVAVDKPAGFHVHPPEDQRHKIPRHRNCLALLRDQLGGNYIYPVHRLDGATTGVLFYAKTSEAASALAGQFKERKVQKTYYAVVRGWPEDQVIEKDLDGHPSKTWIRVIAKKEVPVKIGKSKFETARYAVIEAQPHTGRMHQIRRHLAGISHPLIGDTVYGDGPHNRYFRELGMPGLFLRSARTQVPELGLDVTAGWRGSWHKAWDWFGLCPLINSIS